MDNTAGQRSLFTFVLKQNKMEKHIKPETVGIHTNLKRERMTKVLLDDFFSNVELWKKSAIGWNKWGLRYLLVGYSVTKSRYLAILFHDITQLKVNTG